MFFRALRLLAVIAVVCLGASITAPAAGAHDTHGEYIPTNTGQRSAARAASPTPPPITFPVEGSVTYTDSFGACRGANCERRHEGNDLMGEKLQRLLAANDATVTWVKDSATPDGKNSNILILEDAAGWEYWYIHINNDSPGTDDGANPSQWRFAPGIGLGSTVKAGQHIAYMGDSGNAEWTAPHVHFEIREPGGTAIDPYDNLQNARHFVLGTTSEQAPIVADIDSDPAAEILLYNPGSSADYRYDGTSTPGTFDRGNITVNGTYRPVVGDFDGNGYDDILWYAPGPAKDYIWHHGPSGYTSSGTKILGDFTTMVGDFDRNGYDDIIWYRPGQGQDYRWSYGPGGYVSEPTVVNGHYDPQIGDFDGNGYEDVLWYAAGPAQDYLWSYHESGYVDSKRSIGGSYDPEVGDFDGDGLDDVYWYRPGVAADYLWRHRPDGGYDDIRADNDDEQRPGAGDLDGDGDDDLVWFDFDVNEPDSVWRFVNGSFVETSATVR